MREVVKFTNNEGKKAVILHRVRQMDSRNHSDSVREALNYADSVYILRSNSPPAQRIFAHPFAKIRLREDIY